MITSTQLPLALQTASVYFVIRQFQNSPDNGPDNGGSRGVSKSALEYVFIAVVAFVIAGVVFRRYRFIRSQNQARAFIPTSRQYPNFSPPVELNSLHADRHPYPEPHLTGIPAAYLGQTRPSRRTRAPDIDSSGRRIGEIPLETDHDGALGAKDDLPAYDKFGGPPQYFESDVQNRSRPSWSRAHTPNVGLENIPENVNLHRPVPTTHTIPHSQPENNTATTRR